LSGLLRRAKKLTQFEGLEILVGIRTRLADVHISKVVPFSAEYISLEYMKTDTTEPIAITLDWEQGILHGRIW